MSSPPWVSSTGRAPGLSGWATAGVALLLVAMPLAVLLSVLGLPFPIAAGLLTIASGGLGFVLRARVPQAVSAPLARRPKLFALWSLVALLAVLRLAGVAEFMADPSRAEHSAFAFDEFYTGHNCLTAYYEAALLSREAPPNLYDPAPYQGTLDRFRMDEFLYPPPFLLLPRAALLLSTDFLRLRALWFGLETLLLLGGMLAVAAWVGGEQGGKVALLIPAAFAATPVVLTLQIGNFQLAAFALGLLALVAAERRPAAAGGLLATAVVSKVFPGVLGLAFLVARRHRVVLWTAAWGIAGTLAALLWLGPRPFLAFLRFELPRITSGEAFSWLGLDELAPVAAINDAIPGLVWKLKALGLGNPSVAWVGILGWVYSFLLLAMAALAGRRLGAAGRLHQARLFVALLSLAALRSPFEPDAYALFGPLWLLLLLLPDLPAGSRWWWAVPAAWLVLATVLPFGSLDGLSPRGIALISLAGQILSLALCVGTVLRRAGGLEAAPLTASTVPLAAS